MNKHEMRKGYYEQMRKFKEQYEQKNQSKMKGIGKPRYRMNDGKNSEMSKDEGR